MTDDTYGLNVSRETHDRLDIYAALLRKWNPKINLVAPSTIADLRSRHITDSAQLYNQAPTSFEHWVDLGSGGGFPGLVVAILVYENGSRGKITLIESDARKSAFLRTVLRETGVDATVITDRIENVTPQGADVVSARALAHMIKLLDFTNRHLSPEGVALLHKGRHWEKELRDAQQTWQFTYSAVKSVVQDNSVILNVAGVHRV